MNRAPPGAGGARGSTIDLPSPAWGRTDFFPTPDPALADITTALDKLELWEGKVATVRGATGERDAALKDVHNLLDLQRVYVIKVARKNPAQAAAILAAARLAGKKAPSRVLKGFNSKVGKIAHSIVLEWPTCKGKGNHAYQVQLSVDGGKTYAAPRNSVHATVTLSDRTPGQQYHACVRTISIAGDGAWSEPIPFTVP